MFDQGVEHRLQVEGRAADDLEDVAAAVCCCRDSLKSRARLHLVEQPHILDRDHGLVGEHLQQADVLFAKRAGRDTGDGDDADGLAVVHQRREQHAAIAARPRNVSRRRLDLGVRQFCPTLPRASSW